jgi:prevent-host-death family protein
MATDQSPRRWPVQDAKARFSELLEASLNEGPQIVTRRGVEAAVLVPFEEWRRLQSSARPTLKELLLAETPRAELPVPPRRLPGDPARRELSLARQTAGFLVQTG